MIALVAVAASLLPGCSGEPTVLDVGVPDEQIAPQDWEVAYTDAELTKWRQGRVVELPLGAIDISQTEPCAGATVTLFGTSPSGGRPIRKLAEVTTDADGRFRIGPGLERHWILTAEKDGFARGVVGNAPELNGVFLISDSYDLKFGVRPGSTLNGRLETPTGAPLPGVSLSVESIAHSTRVVTDAEGRFSSFVPDGSCAVRGIDPEYSALAEMFEAPHLEELVVVAPRWSPLRGRVLDAETEAPLAGAVIISGLDARVRAVSGPDGRYELPCARAGRVTAFGNGYGWRGYDVPPAGDLDFRLPPGRVVEGRVVDDAGRPVSGARVLAVKRMEHGVERVLGPATDADGRFRMSWTPTPGRGGGSAVLAAYHRLHGTSGGVTPTSTGEPIELVLAPMRTVTGRLLRHSGATVRDVEVEVSWARDGLTQDDSVALGLPTLALGWTDADGRYRVPNVPAGVELDVTFLPDGARIASRVAPDQTGDVDLTLDAAGSVAGRIQDADGQPVGGPGKVTARLINHPVFHLLERETDLLPDGTFRIDDLPEGEYSVTASAPGFDVAGVPARAGDMDLVMRAEQPAVVKVLPVFPEGVSAERVVVSLHSLTDANSLPRKELAEPGEAARFAVVRAGRYRFTAAGGPFRGEVAELRVADGDRPEIEIPMIEKLRARATILDRAGQPLSGIRVRVVPRGIAGATVQTTFSKEDGSLDLTGLEPGTWQLDAIIRKRPPIRETFQMQDGETPELDLQVEPHGTVRVSFGDEEARGELSVTLRSAKGGFVNAWTEESTSLAPRFRAPDSGDLVLSGVPAGSLQVDIARAGRTFKSESIDVPDGGEALIQVR